MLAARGRRPVWEPFCGGLGISHVWRSGPLVLSDACAPLIALYDALCAGWLPPTRAILPAERNAALLLSDDDPFKAFARFGCGFGGDWAGGTTQDGIDVNSGGHWLSAGPIAGQAARSLMRTFAALPCDVEFARLDFCAVEPNELPEAHRALIYCDPPYDGVESYAAVGPFDRPAFVARLQEWAARGALVFVSEFRLPIGRVVWEATRARHVTGRGTVVERLYRV
jgi:hypothetical protein